MFKDHVHIKVQEVTLIINPQNLDLINLYLRQGPSPWIEEKAYGFQKREEVNKYYLVKNRCYFTKIKRLSNAVTNPRNEAILYQNWKKLDKLTDSDKEAKMPARSRSSANELGYLQVG